jgi:D-beta-D-heptose 7-phosphate kinase/D-beta-D-heptose 1-phosphate adenosyltransferase
MNNKHLIIGDLILDRFIYGETTRVSVEAPTLVLDVTNEIDSYGGAYNVAAHMCSLGHLCDFITVTGSDFTDISKNFKDYISPNCELTNITDSSRKTSLKTRLISNYKKTHLLRYDNETLSDISLSAENYIIKSVEDKIFECDDVLIIDYRKGLITKSLARRIIDIANKHNKPIYVDTKRDDLSLFSNATLIKPNKFEFSKIQLRYAPDLTMENACIEITNKFNIQKLVITAGEEGLYIFSKGEKLIHIEAEKVNATELSGAGDSVLATISYCISKGFNFNDAASAANRVAAKLVQLGVKYRARQEDL